MPFIPGLYLWGNVCKQTLSVPYSTRREGGCEAKGHLCSWEGTWGQEIMACCKGQLPPMVGSPHGAFPIQACLGSVPGCALYQALGGNS